MSPRLVGRFRHALPAAAIAAAALCWPGGHLAAQEGVTTGTIAGTVEDADGTPLANVQVTATSTERGTTRDALTDQEGRFVIPLLRPGTYDVRASLPPSPPAERQGVVVTVGERQTVNLQVQPVAVSELAVEITGRQATVAEGGVVELVEEAQIDNLPTPGRDFTDFIQLSGLVSPQPEIGTGGQFSIGGARTAGTNVQIDGADANNAFFGENRGSSRVPFTFSLNSIREFQIVTNGYDVEFGKFSGGVINAVTKTGTNDFEANAHFFWRDEAFTAENFNSTEPADFQSFQFGGAVSGPIVRDELHFLVSGDFQQQRQPVFAAGSTADPFADQALAEFAEVLESVYGIDPSDDLGQFEETDDQANVFGRLDWSIDGAHQLSVRANYSDFENQNDRIGTAGTDARSVGGTFNDEFLSVVGELNSVFNPTVYNTFRVQYSDELRPRPGNSRLPSVLVPLTAEGGGTRDITYGGSFFGILFANNLEETKVQLTDNLTFNLGDHTVKVGTDNVFTNTFNEFWLNGNGFFDFDDLEAFRNGEPGFFLRFVPLTPAGVEPSAPIADFDTQEFSFYVQDSWRATDRLTLTGGLRYDITNLEEGEPLAIPEFQSAVEAFGVSPDRTPNDSDNISPRLSFTYDLEGDESRVVRGGVGLFYGRIPTVLHSNILAKTPFPLLEVVCFSSNMPAFEYGVWQENPDQIPTQCEGGSGPSGEPEIDVWDEDAEFPETVKANLGYEQVFGERWRGGIQAIFSRTVNNFHVIDLNLRPQVFTTADGRPVFVPEDAYDPSDAASNADRGMDPDLARLWQNVSNAEARAFNLKLEASGRPTDDLQVGANYALNVAYDNSSFSCCLETEAWNSAVTAGSPNELGGIGDDETGTWGPSAYQRRHVFVMNALWELPADFRVSTIYRAQSGNPFTPFILGDLNADGADENDRPFLPDPDAPAGVQFESADDLTRYRQALSESSCLRENVGTIIGRNECTNPWWHSVDMRVEKTLALPGNQNFDLILDLFNVLDGLGVEGGEYVFLDNELFVAEGYDPATDEVIVSVPGGEEGAAFGEEIPVGFEPFQFRAQLGVRYRF